jgi:hypothetical protein
MGCALEILDKWCLAEERLHQTSTADIEHFIAVSSLVTQARRLRTTDLIDLSIDAHLETTDLINRLTTKEKQ